MSMKLLDKIKQNNLDKTKIINKLLTSKKKYKINFEKTGKEKLMGIYEDNKLIINGPYNFFGIYQPYTKLWVWASSIPGVNRKDIKNINDIKMSSHLFESDDDIKINFYYQLLTQDMLLITNEKMLEWINELLIYLSSAVYYFNPTNSDGNVQFLTLVKVKEKHN